MDQVISTYSNKAYFTGSHQGCIAYMEKYGLHQGSEPTDFSIAPFDVKRKLGSFEEQTHIQIGVYKPAPSQVDTILEQKINYAFNPETQSVVKKKISDLIANTNGAVKRDEIIAYLLKLGYEVPERKVRSIIEELINEDGLAIESSEVGYELIKSVEQLKEAIKYLKNKAFPLFERANNLNKNFHRDKSKQLSFEEFFMD